MTELLFGFHHVTGVPFCPCNDPGNYMMLERINGLECRFSCWCGRTMNVTFDSEQELKEFVSAQVPNAG